VKIINAFPSSSSGNLSTRPADCFLSIFPVFISARGCYGTIEKIEKKNIEGCVYYGLF
jgi:hypothetical protein